MQPAREEAILSQFTNKKSHPKNHGKFGSFRKVGRITPRFAVLAEGVLPDPNTVKMYEYRYTLARYGDYIQYSDEAAEYAVDNIDAVLTNEMGYSFKDFIEEKRYQLLRTSKNIWYASKMYGSPKAETAVTAIADLDTNGIFLNDLPKIVAFFRRNHVQPAKGSKYVMVIPPEELINLETLAKNSTHFTLVELAKDIGKAEVVYKGEEGGIFNFVFVTSNSIKVQPNYVTKSVADATAFAALTVDVFTRAADAHEVGGYKYTKATSYSNSATYYEINKYYADCLILGKVKGEWGTDEIALEGESAPEMIRKGIESGGVGNALNQVGSIGWKHHGWGGLVKHEEAVVVYKIGLNGLGFAEWDDANRNTATNLHSEAGKTVEVGQDAGTFAGSTAVTNGVKASS